jgi:ferredoxin-NADP reductase
MLVGAATAKLPHRLLLFYSNRRPEDAAFLEELQALERRIAHARRDHDFFWHRYLWVADRRQRGRDPLVRSGACHDVQRRRLRREVSRVPRSHRAHAHIAGPPDLAKKLVDLPEGTRVHVEGAIERRSHTFLLGVVNPVHAAPTQQ